MKNSQILKFQFLESVGIHFLRLIKNKYGIYKQKYKNSLTGVELPGEYKNHKTYK